MDNLRIIRPAFQVSALRHSADVVWVQEEPLNMGGWRVLSDFIQPLLESTRRTLRYIGRTESASPAAGFL